MMRFLFTAILCILLKIDCFLGENNKFRFIKIEFSGENWYFIQKTGFVIQKIDVFHETNDSCCFKIHFTGSKSLQIKFNKE